jgi:O-antigen/teichoic acid export membrane protein
MGDRFQAHSYVHRAAHALRSSLYSNAIYLMLAQASMAGLGFVFWVIVARYYTEAELGYSSAIISVISLVAMTGHIGLDSFIVRFFAGSDNRRRLLNTCFTYSGLAAAAVALVVAAGLHIWSPKLSFVATQPVFLAAFVAFAVADTLAGMAGAGFVAARQAKYLFYKDVIFSATKLFLPFLFLQRFHAFGIVASWGLAISVGLFASLFVFLPRMLPGYRPAPTLRARLVRRAWGFSGMNYVIMLVSSAPRFVMPLIVLNLLGPEENAYFYVAWAISTLLFSIPTSLGQSLFAEGAYDKRTLPRGVRRATLLSIALLLPAVLFFWLLGDRFLLAFGSSYSTRSIEVLRILALAGLPLTIQRVYFSVLRVRGQLREMIAWRSVLTVVLITASYVSLRAYGLQAIGWVWLVTHSVAAVAMFARRPDLWFSSPAGAPRPARDA